MSLVYEPKYVNTWLVHDKYECFFALNHDMMVFMKGFKPTIGLEIHAELNTESKMFCSSPNDPFESRPNVNICPVCMAHPGTLPVINRKAVEHVVLVGLALGGTINDYTQFDRKNYFYPDIPKGYQISQYEHPIVSGGKIKLFSGKEINITRVHLEEDTATSIHEGSESLVDFNRAGVPLMELVTEPEIETAEEATEFARELQRILRYVGASHARMDKGEMRVEANISVAREGEELGTKVEVKNLNSFKVVGKSIEDEIVRQSALIGSGGSVVQETRGWNEEKGRTVSQRKKESAHDYRYFPEPDLPPLRMNIGGGVNIEEIRRTLPELPAAKRIRFMEEFGFDLNQVNILVDDRIMAGFFEAAHSELGEWLKNHDATEEARKKAQKLIRNYLLSDLAGIVNDKGLMWSALPMTPENFAELVSMTATGKLSSRGAKDLLGIMVAEGGDPSDLVKKHGLTQTEDTGMLKEAIEKVKLENPDAYKEYKQGNENTLKFLIGQTMKTVKEMGSSANPQTVSDMWKDS